MANDMTALIGAIDWVCSTAGALPYAYRPNGNDVVRDADGRGVLRWFGASDSDAAKFAVNASALLPECLATLRAAAPLFDALRSVDPQTLPQHIAALVKAWKEVT